MPLLRHVPSWLPGAGFQRKAASWRKTLTDMANIPHNLVKSEMVCTRPIPDFRLVYMRDGQSKGTAAPSFTSTQLEAKTLSEQEEDNVKWAAASLYSGGADTVSYSPYAFYTSSNHFGCRPYPCVVTGPFIDGTLICFQAIYSFYLAMVLHPEVQQRAQAEIDAVVSSDR